MSKTFFIAERELKAYFVSPMAWAVAAMFMLITGWLFYFILEYTREASMRVLFSNLTVTFLLMSPALTMRLLAEEKRTGTIELLYTSPLRDWETVVGKYLASLLFLAFLLGLTLYCPAVLGYLGDPDWGMMAAGYVGMFLIGAEFLAIGLFASSLTENQVIAAVITFSLCIVLWLTSAAQNVAPGVLGDVVAFLSPVGHLENFQRGVIDSKDLLYYVSACVFFVFAAVQSIESHHWR